MQQKLFSELKDIKVLLTGGAGYIGSHTAYLLKRVGLPFVVVDNLCTGYLPSLPSDVAFYEADVRDTGRMTQIMRDEGITDVLHLAGHIEVEESTRLPLKYYANNTWGSCSLLLACEAAGVKRFIFSSTASVYADTGEVPLRESSPVGPINPYGASKAFTERLLLDAANASQSGLRYVALRYFNVAGAQIDPETNAPSLRVGQRGKEATHLIKIAAQVACGMRSSLKIFGTDYPTPDGTCLRDYIHVDDLSQAHIDAIAYLVGGGESGVFNCGYGQGNSVRDVIGAMQRVSGVEFPVELVERRRGDPSILIADNSKITQYLGWTPRYNHLDLICLSAYLWERKLHSNQ